MEEMFRQLYISEYWNAMYHRNCGIPPPEHAYRPPPRRKLNALGLTIDPNAKIPLISDPDEDEFLPIPLELVVEEPGDEPDVEEVVEMPEVPDYGELRRDAATGIIFKEQPNSLAQQFINEMSERDVAASSYEEHVEKKREEGARLEEEKKRKMEEERERERLSSIPVEATPELRSTYMETLQKMEEMYKQDMMERNLRLVWENRLSPNADLTKEYAVTITVPPVRQYNEPSLADKLQNLTLEPSKQFSPWREANHDSLPAYNNLQQSVGPIRKKKRVKLIEVVYHGRRRNENPNYYYHVIDGVRFPRMPMPTGGLTNTRRSYYTRPEFYINSTPSGCRPNIFNNNRF